MADVVLSRHDLGLTPVIGAFADNALPSCDGGASALPRERVRSLLGTR
ncbi:MAG: hypothetical protein ACRDFX_03020 [Chloroflexota bacterium]